MTDLSFPEIGRIFGGKDHSTVIHACKQVEREIGADIHIRTAVRNITSELKKGAT